VVLVDDDKDILTVLKRGLELNNYEVMAFDKPHEALDYLKSVNSPQLLITDVRMPGMSGFELAKQLATEHAEMKIMMLTSFEINKSEFDQVFPSTKIDALINKPISIRKLIDAVNALMVSKR
jgi:CheY-like chemotaxis protein